MAGSTISIIIRAQNNASGDLQDIRIDIERLGDSSDRASRNASRFGGNLASLGGLAKVAAAGVAAAAASVGLLARGALQAGGNFEAAMNEFAAVKTLDQTSDSFKAAEAAAMEMGSTTKFSATEAANALTFLGRAGFSSEDAVSSLPGVLNLAAASGMDLARTADIASNILSGFGLEISDLNDLNDVLAATAANANVDVSGLGETFKYVGPVAKGAGLTLEETSAAIGKLGDAGIQGSAAGTALRMGLLQMQAPADKAKQALARLGVTTTDSQGNLRNFVDIMHDMNEAGATVIDWKDIVGTEAATAFQLLTDNAQGLDDLAESLNKTNILLQETSRLSTGDFTQLKEGFMIAAPAADSLGISIQSVAAMMGTLSSAGITAAQAGTALRDGFVSLQDPSTAAQATLSELGVSLTDSEGNMRDFVSIMVDMNEAGASVADWQSIVGVDAANAFAALTAEAQGLTELDTNLNNMQGAAESMASTMNQGLNAALKGLGSAFEGLQIAIFKAGLGDIATQMVNDLANAIRSLSSNEQFLESMGAAFTRLAEMVAIAKVGLQQSFTFISALMSDLSNNTDTEVSKLNGSMRVWADATRMSVEQVANFWGSVLASISSDTALYAGEMSMYNRIWVDAIAQTYNDFRGHLSGIVAFAQSTWALFVSVFADTTSIQSFLQNYVEFFTTMRNQILTGLMTWAGTQLRNAFGLVVESVRQMGQNTLAAFNEWRAGVATFFSDMARDAIEWGRAIPTAIANSIRDGIPNVMAQVSSMAQQAADNFKNMLGIRSPSTVFEGFGFSMVEGAIVGIRSNAAAAIGEVEGLANQIDAVLRNAVETTRNYVSAITMSVQAGLSDAASEIPRLQEQVDTLRTRLRDVAGEDGSFIGLSETDLQVAQTISQQLQVAEGQLQSYQGEVEQTEQAELRLQEAQARSAEAASNAAYEYSRVSGEINDQEHLQNLQQQAEAIRRSEGESAAYYNTLIQVERQQESINDAEEQAAQAQQRRVQQTQDEWRKRFEENQRLREKAAQDEERRAQEEQQRQEELNRQMLQQAENIYTSQVVSGMISLEDQISRVEGQLLAAEEGTNEWLAAFRELDQLREQREGNLFELQFVEGDFSDLEELQMRLENTQGTLSELANQRGSSAYLQAAQEEARLNAAINEELERQVELRRKNAVEAERVSRRVQARATTERFDQPQEQMAYTSSLIQRSEGAFQDLADAITKTRNAGVLITDDFFDYLASSNFSRVVTGSVVTLTEALQTLGQASRGDVRTALQAQKTELERLLTVLPQGSEQWYEYAQALAAVNKQLSDMSDQDVATNAAATAAAIDRAGNSAGREANMNAFTSGNRSAREALGVAQTSYDSSVALREKVDPDVNPELYNELSNNIDSAAADIEKFKSAMQSVPMKFLGQQMLSLATDNIPFLGGVIQGFATAGPLGGLISLFTQLAGESEALAEIGEMVMMVVQPVVAIFDQLFTALKPLIGAVLDLMFAFTPLIEIALKILAPVFRILGKVMSAVTDAIIFVINGFVAAYNALLGWLLGRIKKVERTNYDADEEEDKDKSSDSDTTKSSSGAEKGGTTDFGSVPPSVQLAIATPLIEAANKMVYAAELMVGAFSEGAKVGSRSTDSTNNLSGLMERHAAAMTRHSVSMDKASAMFDRLISEGITVNAQSNVEVTDERSATLALR